MSAHPSILRPLMVPARRRAHGSRAWQVGVVGAVWLAGEAIVRATGLPLPGGIVGLAILLALLASGRLSVAGTRRGAEWLLADMLLFFVPAVPAVLDHRELAGLLGLKIMAVIVLGTLLVMVATAAAVDLAYRWRSRHGSVD